MLSLFPIFFFFAKGIVTNCANNSKLLFWFPMQWLPDGNITLSLKTLKTFLPFYEVSNKVMVLFTVLVKLSNMQISRHQSCCFLEKLS